jgi:hypothetical protein
MARYSYKKALGILVDYANAEGYSVNLDSGDISVIMWHRRTLNWPNEIRIEGKYSNEYKVYLLLHELGHHILRRDWGKFSLVLPIAAYAESKYLEDRDMRYKRRVTYDVSCVEEEFKAWDEGYKLANRLGIRINEGRWLEFKSRCLMSHIRYYSKKSR